jgi:hypothetical protein
MGMGRGMMLGMSGKALDTLGVDRDEGVINFRVTFGSSWADNMVMTSYEEKGETMRRRD